MTGTFAQLRALVGLRWRMVRSPNARAGLALLMVAVLLVMVAGVGGALVLPEGSTSFNAALLTPTAFLVFAVLSVAAPLAAGGGYDLFPAEQLAAYPVRPATSYAVTLVVAPLNVAWLVQVATLLSLTSYVVGSRPGLPAALALTLGYVAVMTMTGQSLAWFVIGLRRTPPGRWAAWTAAAVLAAVVAVAARHGIKPMLDHSPTRSVVLGVFAAGAGQVGQAARLALALAAAGFVAARAGVAAASWTLRRPDLTGAGRQAGLVRRRSPRRSVAAELRSTDRASVWRAPALRRGALVIALLPGVVAAGARLPWDGLAVTSGLVAAGAGLLFGVNVFCLDGSGALWLASLPHRPRAGLLAKARILAETCVGTATLAAAAGALRAPQAPAAADVAAVVGSILCCSMLVVGTCLRLSVERPHRADLRGPRDTPAPPGTMAAYSMRLAIQTTFAALIVGTSAKAGIWWIPLALSVAIGFLGLSTFLRSMRRFDDDLVRTRVALTVASG